MKKSIIVALLLTIAAQGAWGSITTLETRPTEGPWTYIDAGCMMDYQYKNRGGITERSFSDLDQTTWEIRTDDYTWKLFWNHPWHDVVYQWQDGDGLGFTQCCLSYEGTHFAVYSIYEHKETLQPFTRKRLTWDYRLKGRTSEFPQCVALYARNDLYWIKTMPVDFTHDYSSMAGSEYLIANFIMPKGVEKGSKTSIYTDYFDFDNRRGASEQTKSWYIMLTNSIWAGNKDEEGIHHWASFKNQGSSWDTYYYKYITFHANGAQAEGTMEEQEIENSGNLRANAFTRPGFTFVGWATEPNGPKVYNDQGKVTATSGDKGLRDLYAVWETSTEAGVDIIKKIGIVKYTPECGDRIEAARAVCDSLTEEQKAAMPKYSLLLVAEKAYNVEGLIEAIGTVTDSTECQERIVAARNAYNALTTLEKAFVINYRTLVEAEDNYAALHAGDLINADLNDPVNIAAAQNAYSNLNDNAKAQLTAAQLEKLQHAVNNNDEDKSAILFVDNNDETIRKQVVDINYPDAPVISGFTFQYWQIVPGSINVAAGTIQIQAIYEPNGDPTDIPDVYINPANPAQKLIRNGKVYILKDGKTYTITGAEVK